MYTLRGHHLFCLLGYRGMGYSEEYTENMTALHQILRDNPKTVIKIVNGPDHLCEKYPKSAEYHCQNDDIYKRDAAILGKIGFKIGQVLRWEDIESHIRNYIVPADVQIVCETCSWRSYGFCEEGIKAIKEEKGLRKIK